VNAIGGIPPSNWSLRRRWAPTVWDVEHACREPVTVELLADRPDLLIPLAQIRWREWGDHPGREDLQWWIDTTRSESGGIGLPVTFVAVDPVGQIVGGVGLIPVEHLELADRGPWVVGTIVRADRRSHGVGAALMSQLLRWSVQAGIDQLWVATGGRAIDFYRRCGFAVVEVAKLRNGDQPTILTAQPAEARSQRKRATSRSAQTAEAGNRSSVPPT
jgi:GNAT superfamily N-acetyltransferase